MIGVISAFDPQKRIGYIKDPKTEKSYYFGLTSVIDRSLPLKMGIKVTFDLYETEGRTVAVKIGPHRAQPSDNRVNATVLWYHDSKKYGYVTCDTKPPQDAFLHQKHLLPAGVSSVQPGQKLRVRLVENKYPGKPAAVDVTVITGSSNAAAGKGQQSRGGGSFQHRQNDHHRHFYERHTTAAMSKQAYTSNDLAAIPCTSSSGHRRPPINAAIAGISRMNIQDRPGMNPMHGMRPRPRFPNQRYCNGTEIPLNPPRKPRYISPIENKTYTNPECAKLSQQIYQKESLLKSISLTNLPDNGDRLRKQIQELKTKLRELSLEEKNSNRKAHSRCTSADSSASSTLSNHSKSENTKPQVVFDTISAYNEEIIPKDIGNYYGGRMTTKKIAAVTKVTAEAIETLHSSLNTCPPATSEMDDPDGLLLTLMPHQKQAMTWLVWREEQPVSGGVLADDMGLGKTLTMISLILQQKSLAEVGPSDNADNSKINAAEEQTPEHQSPDAAAVDGDRLEADENGGGKKPDEDASQTADSGNADTLVASDSTLIVAPASLIYHWENEIRNRCKKGLLSIHLFHGTSREKDAEKLAEFDVVITTYDIVRRCKPKGPDETSANRKESTKVREATLFLINWRRIILDEAHQIRNHKSQTSVAVCSLNAKSRWALSGTPVQNQETDIYAIIKFLHCHPFDEYKLWKNQVGNNTDIGQKRLKTIVSSLVLRREKNQKGADGKQLIDLPKRTCTTHRLKLNEVEQEVYQKLKLESQTAFQRFEKSKKSPRSISPDHNPYDETASSSQTLTASTLLVMLLRLRQCCCHLNLLKNKFDPDLLEKEKQQIALEDLFQTLAIKNLDSPNSFDLDSYSSKDKESYFEKSSTSSKVKIVMDKLNQLSFENPNDKCVIISQWTSLLRILAVHLEQSKLSYAIIEGSVSARKRMDLVDDFNRNPIKPKIMLVSLQAGGVGLNLIGGNHLFLLDMHWNPALEKQAFDRIYRVGQTKDVFIHKFVVENTVEEKILQLQQRKLSIAAAIMEGADVENKTKLTLADMKVLFDIQ